MLRRPLFGLKLLAIFKSRTLHSSTLAVSDVDPRSAMSNRWGTSSPRSSALRRVPASLTARPGPMQSEGRLISRPSRHLIRRATSFHRPLHPSSWPTFLFFRDFLFCLHNFHVRCSRTQPHFWERTVSACIMHQCSVFARPPPFFLLHFLLAYFPFLFLFVPLCAIYLEGY